MRVMEAKATVHLSQKRGTISPNIYGTMWDWRDSAWGGIWVGEGSQIPNVKGFHEAAIDALKEIAVPVIQFFPETPFYKWEDGIGPREKRPNMLLPWGRFMGHEPMEVSNDVGTDEIVQFCRMIGAEPFMDTNENDPLGSRDWVEYCNYNGDTKYACMRRDNGHPEPHNIKFWHVYAWGDEDPVVYAMNFRKFANTARLIDPRIHVIASGAGGPEWTRKFFETLDRAMTQAICGRDLIDHMGSMHYFGVLMKDVEFSDNDYCRLLSNVAGMDDALKGHDEELQHYSQGKGRWGRGWLHKSYDDLVPDIDPIGMAICEWGVNWASRIVPLRDAIAGAAALDTFHRWASRIHIAFAVALTTGQALVQTEGDKVWLTPNHHLFKMYMPHRGKESLEVAIDCENMAVSDEGGEMDFFGSQTVRPSPPSALSSSASIAADASEIILSISNRHLTDAAATKIKLEGASAPISGKIAVLTSDSVRDYNDADNPNRVALKTEDFTPEGSEFNYTLPPHSIITFTLKMK